MKQALLVKYKYWRGEGGNISTHDLCFFNIWDKIISDIQFTLLKILNLIEFIKRSTVSVGKPSLGPLSRRVIGVLEYILCLRRSHLSARRGPFPWLYSQFLAATDASLPRVASTSIVPLAAPSTVLWTALPVPVWGARQVVHAGPNAPGPTVLTLTHSHDRVQRARSNRRSALAAPCWLAVGAGRDPHAAAPTESATVRSTGCTWMNTTANSDNRGVSIE